MARQIIKQPNGLYCMFSTIVDNVTYYNCSKEEIVEYFQSEYGRSGKENAEEVIEKLERGEKPYLQFTKTFDAMLELIGDIHGKSEVENLLSLIN